MSLLFAAMALVIVNSVQALYIAFASDFKGAAVTKHGSTGVAQQLALLYYIYGFLHVVTVLIMWCTIGAFFLFPVDTLMEGFFLGGFVFVLLVMAFLHIGAIRHHRLFSKELDNP